MSTNATIDRTGATTGIEWTQRTWNPLAGCSMCSPGCARCYAETMAKRLRAMAEKDVADGKDPGRKRYYLDVIGSNGKWNGHIALIPEALDEPLRRKQPATWFVNSMSDLFHEGVPFDFVDRVFAVMALTPQHTYQVLTKRPERMAEYLRRPRTIDWFGIGAKEEPVWRHVSVRMNAYHGKQVKNSYVLSVPVELGERWPLPNVWLGTSVEDQNRADERIPHLLRCPAAVRFLSCEPLLGPIEFSDVTKRSDSILQLGKKSLDGIHWVIVGGESGAGARPCNVEWVRSIVGQCRAAGVTCFVKQLGANVQSEEPGFTRAGETIRVLLKDKKGGDPAEWPEDLRVREFPKAEVPHA